MRRLGTLGDPEAARRFADLLRNRGIPAEFRVEAEGTVGVWVRDEDHLPAAREELARFESSPEAYSGHVAAPPQPRPPASPAEPPSAERRTPAWRRAPLTVGVAAACVLATLWTNFGDRPEPFARLAISSEIVEGNWSIRDHLRDIQHGQIWRLITPALMHGSLLHIAGNLAWWWVLGGAVESVRGSLRLALLALVIAAVSNLAEYWFDFGLTFDAENGLRSGFALRPDPRFLGLSGVVFGLFGFVWMRARLLPGSRFVMPRDLVVWQMIWLLACIAGFVGPIANVAHGVGLLTGMAIGAAPRLWRRA